MTDNEQREMDKRILRETARRLGCSENDVRDKWGDMHAEIVPQVAKEAGCSDAEVWEALGKPIRRSRKHVLDWVSLNTPDFLASLNDIVGVAGATVTSSDRWMPSGYGNVLEAKLDELDGTWPHAEEREALASWWLAHRKRANTPNWDFLSTAMIGNMKGLILVEAKAHATELDPKGKRFDEKTASQASKENNVKIGKAITDANAGLNQLRPGFSISRGSHYQLSNRMAFGWKMATLGIPTVLVYLGFYGDTGIHNSARPLMSEQDWRQAMKDYAKGLLPDDFVEEAISKCAVCTCGNVPFAFLIRSRKVKSPTVYPKTAERA